jgi:hypothetical protein
MYTTTVVQFNVFGHCRKGEKNMLRFLLVISTVLAAVLWAGHALALEVAEAVITTAVVDREPVDEVEVFPIQGEKLYCFTRITGAGEPTTIYHLWYYGEQLMSRVELPVQSPDWRTWSAKGFLATGQGDWRIEIQDASGMILRQVSFQLR